VIIAVGIFAGAVAVMLGLLPPLTRQAAASADTLAALRLPDGVRLELQRVAALGGFDTLATQARPMGFPLPATLSLVASRDAARVHTLSYRPPASADQLAPADQYFLIEVWTFNLAPLAFDPGGSVLALHVRVSWPNSTPAALAPTPLADREQVAFTLSLTR
jgi:hypothetical protein